MLSVVEQPSGRTVTHVTRIRALRAPGRGKEPPNRARGAGASDSSYLDSSLRFTQLHTPGTS